LYCLRGVPGMVDVHLHQRMNQPALNLDMERTSLQHLNLSAANVAQNVLVSLSGTFQTAPANWVFPQLAVA
jgi:Cu/Ag efflux pump CusA